MTEVNRARSMRQLLVIIQALRINLSNSQKPSIKSKKNPLQQDISIEFLHERVEIREAFGQFERGGSQKKERNHELSTKTGKNRDFP